MSSFCADLGLIILRALQGPPFEPLQSGERAAINEAETSCWIVDAIALAYTSVGLQCPTEVRANSTRGMTSSWAWSKGVSIGEICVAAGWSSPSSLASFYNLDVPAL